MIASSRWGLHLTAPAQLGRRPVAGRDQPEPIVARRCRALYVVVPKAACTSMAWGLMELEGHDRSVMSRSRMPLLTTPDVLVHDPDLYPIPTIDAVAPDVRRAAVSSPDWLRFAVVRNPFARLYSAWESKVLLKPGTRHNETPALVETADGLDVGASFRTFVAALAENPDRWMVDRHFRSQSDLVAYAGLNDIELIPTAGMVDLFARLSERAGTAVTPPRSNEGLGIDGTRFLDQETAATIAELYRQDFELTGSDPNAYEPGAPLLLDPVAVRLLRLANARGARTVLLDRSHRLMPEQRIGRKIRQLTARLGGASRPRR